MSSKTPKNPSRRSFIKLVSGSMAIAAGAGLLPSALRRQLSPINDAMALPTDPANLFYVGTDGWISLPQTPTIPTFHPDVLAPTPFSTYIFGFRNMTGLSPMDTGGVNMNPLVIGQKMKAQHNAPLFWVNEWETEADTFRLDLLNIGLQMRPDLTDSHSIHWHGFRNVIPFFDGEPTGSFAVPVGRVFRYIFKPRDPGTYMFHCHVEDTEHVHMGMTGLVFVNPKQNGQSIGGFTKFAYNDGDGSTGYNRQFAMFLSEVWAEAHWADAHIQLPEWSDYKVDFALLNGRVYPDTLQPNSPFNLASSAHAYDTKRDSTGDLVPTTGQEHLQYQPLSALVTCNAGERVLLRFANLGFKETSMTLAGIKMKVVGKDATPMRGFGGGYNSARTGTDTSYETNTLSFGAGESIDAIFTAPAYISEAAGYNTYVLYNRAYNRSDNQSGGAGSQRTEIRVYPGTTISAQTIPNENPTAA
ncbi:MAG: multicopper oxidase domain-containing protein [Methylococcaceae bacterium]|nr:multicopper oxidase domain-containing protein [Methylococcaceae bacterium]